MATSVNAYHPRTSVVGHEVRRLRSNDGATVDLSDYVRALRRRWFLMLVCVLASVGTAVVATSTVAPQYSSTARVFISTNQSSTSEALQGAQLSAARITSYAQMISTRELAAAVADDLDTDLGPDALRGRVTAEVVPETFIIAVQAFDSDPGTAQAMAQSFAAGLASMVEDLEISNVGDQQFIKATVFEAASFPSAPFSPQPRRNLLLGLLVGVVLALCAAVVRELLDNTIRAGADLSKTTTVPVLGDVPFDAAAQVRDFNDSLDLRAPGMEAYRVLRTNLQFVEVDSDAKIIVVTSPVPGEGKTTTSVNLAIAHAQAGQRVLLVEADLRRPRASAALGLDQSIGLTTVLIGKVELDEALQIHVNGTLHVLSSGALPPNPAELLQSRAMTELLQRLRPMYDVIIIDAPPLLPVTDAAVLAAKSDGAIVVVRHGRTRKEQLSVATSRLAQVDASAIGIVINMTRGRQDGSYGYGYGYDTKNESLPRPARKTTGQKTLVERR